MFIFRRSLPVRLASAQANLRTLRDDAIAEAEALDEAIIRLARQATVADDVVFAIDGMIPEDEPDMPAPAPAFQDEGF